jgi:ankyrin repeat protein
MVAGLAVLCVIIYAECVLTASAKYFLEKALHAKESEMPGMFDEHGGSPMGVAAAYGCASYLKDLVDVGYDINGLDNHNLTALCIASSLGTLEVLTELFELGAGIEIPCGEDGATALVYAAWAGEVEVVRRLLQSGARANSRDKNGATAVYVATSRNHSEVIEVLLEAGADPNLSGEGRETPLWLAVFNGAIEAVKVLARNGANLEERLYGYTALHGAAMLNMTEMVKVLVEAGANVDALDDNGKDAHHFAAENGNVEIVRYLKAGMLLNSSGADL